MFHVGYDPGVAWIFYAIFYQLFFIASIASVIGDYRVL